MRSISVCMPAYNEADNLPGMICDVSRVFMRLTDDYEIVVTNDGSRDATGKVLRELKQEHPCLVVVGHDVNQGYGASVYSAFMRATKELIFFTDSDRQFVIEEVGRLLPLIETHDLVVGYRAPRKDPLIRVLNGKGWSLLVTLLFGYTARDIDCAFKLFRREVIQTVGPSIRSRGATFSAEWLVRARRAGFRITEVPVSHLPREAGAATGARPDVILRAFRELASFRLALFREGSRPIADADSGSS